MGIARNWRDASEQLPGLDRVEVDFQQVPPPPVDYVVQTIGKLDALVVTAGYGHPGVIWNLPRGDMDNMIWANLHLPALILQAAIHCTKHILLTASIAGVRQREGSSVYAGTKAGLIAMADSARRELPDHVIQTISFDNVNAVGPKKVMGAYMFLLSTPGNIDVHLSR